MRYVYLALSTLLLTGWLYLGSVSSPGGLPLPAVGPFFHPGKGFWQNGRQFDTRRTGERQLRIDHPLAGGEIYFDQRGVPHIFADSLAQAVFLQGYIHATDRLWQMDITTRATEGRLSEILGARTQERDTEQVKRGYRLAAHRAADTIARHFPEEYALLEAYAAGVNARIAALRPADYPLEYKLLGHQPLRWSPYRTALLMKGMSQALSGRSDDVAEARTRAALGEARFAQLFPGRFPGADPVVPASGTYRRRKGPPVPSRARAAAPGLSARPGPASTPPYGPHPPGDRLTAYTALAPHPDNGSNNWAVSGQRSNTGMPLLASDPHLGLTLPSVWSEAQLHYPGVNARGVGLPGAPGLMMGFNDYVAYGETNVGHDVTDWFRIEWTDSNRTHYWLDGVATAATIVTDTIYIRNAAPRILRTPWTIFGPVPYTEGQLADYAMRYLAHDAPGKSVRTHALPGTFLRLMAARTYADYRTALTGYSDPAQNFIFAARDGDIALRPNGLFPLRSAGSGRFPLPGNTRANAWRGYLPFADRPEHKNPARGFVASANQVTTPPDFAYEYHGGFDEYRGRYINRHLRKQRQLTQRDMKELQLDSYNLLAEELTPLLIARVNRRALTAEGRRLLRLLSEWDYRCRADSRAATLFFDWQQRLYRLTFDELPVDSGYLQPDLWCWNALIATVPEDDIFDIKATDFRETVATLTQRAFDEMLETLAGELPATWSEARDTRIPHLGQIPGFGTDQLFTAGSRQSPRALQGSHGASWRMVVELGETPRAWGALPGGASGSPASPFYDDGIAEWSNGRYHELTRWRDRAEARQLAKGVWAFGQ